MKQPDGGLAFPFKCERPTAGPEIYYGMTFRQYAAVAALQGLLANSGNNSSVGGFVDMAIECADTLIAELSKEEQ